jgi:hypothetical protein
VKKEKRKKKKIISKNGGVNKDGHGLGFKIVTY